MNSKINDAITKAVASVNKSSESFCKMSEAAKLARESAKPMLVTTVIKRPFTFLLTFPDGRTEEKTVQTESESAAVLLLPDKAEVGEYEAVLLPSP